MQNKFKYLSLLLPGLLPLFVFILADEFAGTTNAIILALIAGGAVFVYTWIRNKKADAFVLFDTLLLAAFGGVSLLLHDDIFFKLKPGIIQTILVVIIGLSAYSPRNIMLNMAQRYMPDKEFDEAQLRQLRSQTRVLFWLFFTHTLLVFYSAFYMSKEAWAFISGGLFYVIAGLWFVVELVRQRILRSNIEWLPVLNEEGKVIGKASRAQVHSGSKVLHPVVHLHVFNKKGELFVQKRSIDKDIQPGKWDTSVGGHISFKETPQKALQREAKEELNIKTGDAKFLFSYIWESDVEKEFVYTFAITTDQEVTPDPRELAGGTWMKIGEIKSKLGKSFFTPNFEHEFQMLIKRIVFK
ncbi:MAG TPA: NUDIX domain-containing protein [Salinivirga sp.]|nr:NUDIX domain-containing protein [Salinivirga sp.]HKK59882.1 NUDIX domain-containing protein [Salinivirga sp.]